MVGKHLLIITLLVIVSGYPGCNLFELEPLPYQEEIVLVQENEMDYLDGLLNKSRTSMADAARLVLPLIGESPYLISLVDLSSILLERGIIQEEWEISETAPLTKGRLAYMICRAAEIETSLTMKMGLPFQRFALREAVFHGLMESSSIYRYVPGEELLDIMAQTEDFIRKREIKRSGTTNA